MEKLTVVKIGKTRSGGSVNYGCPCARGYHARMYTDEEDGEGQSRYFSVDQPLEKSLHFRYIKFMKESTITAYIEKDPETGYFVGIVPDIPGAHTQAETLDELYLNLKEVLTLCIEEMTPDERKNLPHFVGIHNIEVAV